MIGTLFAENIPDTIEPNIKSIVLLAGVDVTSAAQAASESRGKIQGYGSQSSGLSSFIVDGRPVRSMDEWGVSTVEEYEAIRCSVGPMWRTSAAATAGVVYSTLCIDAKCLPDAYRDVARYAIFGGPTLCVDSRPVESAYMVDRVAAYLYEMSKPMPVARDWAHTTNSRAVERLVCSIGEGRTDTYGIVDVTVNVPLSLPFGPLPVRVGGRVQYPVGRVRGIWPAAMLARTMDAWAHNGVTYDIAHRGAFTSTARTMLQVFEWLSSLKEVCKPAAKAIYTRVYGIMCDGPQRVATVRPHSVMWRTVERKRSRMPTCRPDIAGAIAGGNHAETMALAGVNPDDTLLTHVDAVLLRGPQDYPRTAPVGQWAVKAQGPARALAAGVYRLAGGTKFSGVPAAQAVGAFNEVATRLDATGALPVFRADGRRTYNNAKETPPVAVDDAPVCQFGSGFTLGGWEPMKKD